MESFDVIRSVAAPGAVLRLARDDWDVDGDEAVLVRSLVNDVWRITAGTRRFAVKVYRALRWSVEQVAWEQDLACLLHREGLTDSAPLRLSDGRLAGSMRAPEGTRPVAVMTWSNADKPHPPFTDALYAEFGALAARFHDAATSLSSTHAPRVFDLESVLGTPTVRVARALRDLGRTVESRLVTEKGDRAYNDLAALEADGLRRGVRHGDVSLDNVLLGPQGLLLHDFDLSGYGWPAADLVGALSTPQSAAFRDGYESVRPLQATERQALPLLRVAELMRNLDFHLTDKTAIRGIDSVGEGWVDAELAALRDVDV